MKNITLLVALAFCISVCFTNCSNAPTEKAEDNETAKTSKKGKNEADLPKGCKANFTFSAKVNPSFFEYGDVPTGNVVSLEVYDRTLSIENHRFSKLPKEILNANCIESMKIKRNFLTEFPVGLLKQNDLKKIDLSLNKITKFPDIKTPTQVVSLNLSGNQIKEIPASIKLFTNLEHLYLEDMESLEKIHDDIKELKKLKHLVIKKTPVGRSYTKSRKLIKLLPNTQVFWFSKK